MSFIHDAQPGQIGHSLNRQDSPTKDIALMASPQSYPPLSSSTIDETDHTHSPNTFLSQQDIQTTVNIPINDIPPPYHHQEIAETTSLHAHSRQPINKAKPSATHCQRTLKSWLRPRGGAAIPPKSVHPHPQTSPDSSYPIFIHSNNRSPVISNHQTTLNHGCELFGGTLQADSVQHELDPTTNDSASTLTTQHKADFYREWGDTLVPMSDKNFRIHHLNYNGFKFGQSVDHIYFMSCLLNLSQELHPSLISCNEINTNVDIPKVKQSLRQAIKQVLPLSSYQLSHTPDDFRDRVHKPGGNGIIIADHWINRIIQKGSDKLGRWTYVTLQGRTQKLITFISAYRIPEFTYQPGPLTVHQQEYRALMLSGHPPSVQPRKQFDVQLIAFINSLRTQRHEIVLMLDANEKHGTDNGIITQLQMQCNLFDVIDYRFPLEVSPPTYQHGSSRIDYVLTSRHILDYVSSITILPIHSQMIIADHRAIVVDLDVSLFTDSNEHSPIQPPAQRGVKLLNSKVTDKYTALLSDYVQDHNMVRRAEQISQRFRLEGATQDNIDDLDKLDSELTRYMIAAERQANKLASRHLPWSPALHSCIVTLKYWKARMAVYRNSISFADHPFLHKWRTEFHIEDALLDTESYIRTQFKIAWTNYKQVKANAPQLREAFLQKEADLREARGDGPSARILRRLLLHEQVKHTWSRIKKAHHPPRTSLTSLLVPSADHQGYDTLTVKEDIHQKLLQRNYAQLKAAMSSPLLRLSNQDDTTLPNQSDTIPTLLADGHLFHKFPLLFHLLSDSTDYDLYPLTDAEIQFMRNIKAAYHTPRMSSRISEKDFRSILQATDELTSSSPSGRHYGLYKAIVNKPTLLHLYTIMVSLPFKYGFVLKRWRHVSQVMLLKKEKPWIDKLRIIELFEADYNAVVKLLMRRLLWFQIKHNITCPGTFGSVPKGSTFDAMFTRQFSFDLHRITKHPLTLIDNDAKSCYDRIIPYLAAKLFSVAGVPVPVAQTIMNQLIHREASVLTSHGMSSSTIKSSHSDPLFGIGQGNGAGPAAWHCHLLLLIRTVQQLHPGYSIWDPTHYLQHQQPIVSFVDDTSFILTAQPTQLRELTDSTNSLLNIWNNLLHFTGGQLALEDKTKWVLSYYTPIDNKLTLSSLTSDGYSISLKDDDTPIHRIPPTQAERYLGVRIAVSGQMDTEYNHRIDTAKAFSANIQNSTLTKHEVWISFRAIWSPKINYCLPITSFSQTQCNKIQSIVLQAVIPRLGMNRKFPRAVLYGPLKYGGLGFPNLFTEQGILHIKWIVSFYRNPRSISSLFNIYLRHTQLEAGIREHLFQTASSLLYLTPTWLTSTIAFMQQHQITLNLTDPWIPAYQREGDRCLMDLFISKYSSSTMLSHLNQCRIYMKVFFLSDIYTSNGNQLERWVVDPSQRPRRSIWDWPYSVYPPKASWDAWRKAIRQTLYQQQKLIYKLGRWQCKPHQIWPTTLTTIIYPTTHVLCQSYHSFDEYLQSIPDIHRTIIGRLEFSPQYTFDGMFIAFISGQLIVACIGYRNSDQKHTVHSVTISSITGVPLIQSFALTPKSRELPTELRSTWYSLYAYSLLIHHVIEYKKLSSTITGSHPSSTNPWDYYSSLKLVPAPAVYITDQKIVSMVRRHQKRNLQDQLSSHFNMNSDIIHALLMRLENLPFLPTECFGLRFLKIRTYKKVEDTPVPQLIYEALETRAHHYLTNSIRLRRQTPIASHIPEAQVTVESNHIPVTTEIDSYIRNQAHVHDLTQYILAKTQLSEETVRHIDWQAFHLAFASTTIPHRFAVAKLIHGWLNTGTKQAQIYSSNAPTCPNCACSETVDHVFQCLSAKTYEIKKASIIRFYKKLQALKMKPDLIHTLHEIYDPWLHLYDEQLMDTSSYTGSFVMDLASDQRMIGISQLARGRISSMWCRHQFDLTSTSSRPTKSQQQWTQTFITHLWQLSFDLWAARNEILHKSTPSNPAQSREWLEARVVEYYNEYESFPHPILDACFNTTLQVKQQEQSFALMKWITTVDILRFKLVAANPKETSLYELSHQYKNSKTTQTTEPNGSFQCIHLTDTDVMDTDSYQLHNCHTDHIIRAIVRKHTYRDEV